MSVRSSERDSLSRLRERAGVRATRSAGRASMGQRRLRPDTPTVSFSRARIMRRTGTPAELALWRAVRHRALFGLKLRRQVPCGPWILDFAAVRHRLAIELDGETHATGAGAARDAERDAWLVARGWRVLRFANREVLQNRKACSRPLRKRRVPKALTPALSRKREREESDLLASLVRSLAHRRSGLLELASKARPAHSDVRRSTA
jgi:very-short-patch-repair endonuclease